MIFKAKKNTFAKTRAQLERDKSDIDYQACVNAKKVISYFFRNGNHFIKSKKEIFEKPWFLLYNLSQSDRDSFVDETLGKPLIVFPTNQNQESNFNDIYKWNYYNEKIWIETSEEICNEDDKKLQLWSCFAKSLRKVKRKNTLSGLFLVVDIDFFMKKEQSDILKKVQEVKLAINQLQSNIKNQIPLYLIIQNCEQITGFSLFLNKYPGKETDGIIGLTINSADGSDIPDVISKETETLKKNIEIGVFEKIGSEPDDEIKRKLCFFLMTFNEIQQKITFFLTELIYRTFSDKQLMFSGFYFTSNAKNGSDLNLQNKNDNDQITPQTKICSASTIINQIITDEIVRTKKKNPTFYSRTFLTFLTVILLGLSIIQFVGYKLTSGTLKYIASEINKIPESDSILLEQYYAIDRIQQILRKIENNRFLDIVDKKRKDDIYRTLRLNYYKRVKRFIIMPAVKYLEYQLVAATDNRYAIIGERYEHIYKVLRCYLLLSEAAPREYKMSDLLQQHPLILDAIRQSIFTTIRSTVLAENVETILSNTIEIYLKELHKDRSLRIQENQKLISIVRSRMKGVINVKEMYKEKVDKYSNQFSLVTLENILNRDKRGILQTNKTISSFYSQDGWENFVKVIIPDILDDTCVHDWVVGDENGITKNKYNDTAKIKDALIEIYFNVCKEEWVAFLNSIYMHPFSSIEDASKALIKLTGDNGEIQLLLEKVSQYTLIKDKNFEDLEKLSHKEKKITKVKEMVLQKGLKKLLSSESSVYLKEYNEVFDKLRNFINGDKEGKCAYTNYKENITEISQNLLAVKENEFSPQLQQFDGKETDLLSEGYKNTQRELAGLSDELSSALQKILLNPYRYTASPISKLIMKRLNTEWQNEIVNYFSNKLSSKYPFERDSKIDASFSDVMDFFRPSTGVFWGFFDRELSMVFKKGKNGWIKINHGLIELPFNPVFDSSLKYSERISTMFFNSDGSSRSFEMKISSYTANQNIAQIEASGQKIVLKPGSSPNIVKWPGVLSQKTALSVYLNDSFSTGISYDGPWCFLKLLEASKVNKLDANTFIAKWKINVQNMYSVYVSTRFQIPGGDDPFSEPIFEKVTIPSVLLITK